jgi:hypothetical protein
MNGKEKVLDQLKNNHQQCQNFVLARGWDLLQRSGEIELTMVPESIIEKYTSYSYFKEWQFLYIDIIRLWNLLGKAMGPLIVNLLNGNK